MNLVKTFIYASRGHVPDYFIDQNENSFKIIKDQLGSIRLVVNTSNGEVIQKMVHDEFGRVIVDTKPHAIPFGFAGGLYDHETGLVRFGARDYDPNTGRWTAKDSIRFDGGDSNLYGYVVQDPINFIDSKGKSPEYLDDLTCWLTGRCSPAVPDSPDWTDTIGDIIDEGLEELGRFFNRSPNYCK